MEARQDSSSASRESDRSGLALLAVAAAVVTWGWSNVAIKSVSVTGLVASFWRLWIAIPALWLTALAMPAVRRDLGRPWLLGSLVGGFLFGLHQVLFFTSLKETSVSDVSIIGSLQPVLVLFVAGPLFGEPIHGKAIAWSIVALLGTALVVIGAHGSPGWSAHGDLLACLNLFVFTTYFLTSKRIRRDVGATAYVTGMTTVAGFVVTGVCLWTGQDLGSPRPGDWPILVGIAMVSGTLGHVLMNWAHAHASAFVVSILLLGVPVLATTGAAVYLGEIPGLLQIVGGLLVLSSIAVIVLSTRREVAEELAESAAETDAP